MDASVPVDLSDLKTQLDAWRQSHRKRARIPDHFYKTAVSLLDRYSVSAICQQTRLRPASLRKHAAPPQRHVAASPVGPPSSSSSSPFLQLNASALVPRHAPPLDSHARLLFERADGSRLTLNLGGASPAQLEALCATFLRS
ncbi:MAG: hypothetical protein M3R15_15865 [Acidobacteriota bacterium]|nr:hypothetical protein [Acidobacteriota bacterium]